MADCYGYKPGDAPPRGYLNWHAWAEVQANAGLQQKQCSQCGLWRFPQELNGDACTSHGVAGTSPTEPKGGA